MAGDAHQTVTGFAGPAHGVHAFQNLVVVRIIKLVSSALRIDLVRVRDVGVTTIRQTNGRISHITDGEDHGIDVDVSDLVRGLAGNGAITFSKNVFRYAQALNSSGCVRMNGLGRAEETEAEPRTCNLLRRRGQDRESLVSKLAYVLPDGVEFGLNPAKLVIKSSAVKELLDMIKFLLIKFGFEWATPSHNDYLFRRLHWRIQQQPARDVHHNIAHADDGNALSGGEIVRRIRRQQVVVIDEILGCVNAAGGFTGQAQLLGTLRAHRENDGRGIQRLEIGHGNGRTLGHGHMAKIMKVIEAQNFIELLAQSNLHFVLGGINAVFGQSAGLDVAIKDNGLVAGLGNLLCGKHSRRTRANDEYRFHVCPPETVAVQAWHGNHRSA